MTTDNSEFQMISAFDVFKENQCINLPRINSTENHPVLAAIEVSQRSDPSSRKSVLWACIRHACKLLAVGTGPLRLWLFACVAAQDNRMGHYNKLWKGLSKQGFEANMRVTEEKLQKIDDRTICFYGAAELDYDALDGVQSIVTPSSRSFLACLPEFVEPEIDTMISSGWKRGFADLQELRDLTFLIADQGGVSLRLFGEFDDQETGLDCIMNPRTYASVSQNAG